LNIAAQNLILGSKKADLSVCYENNGSINAKTGLTQTLTHTGKSPDQYGAVHDSNLVKQKRAKQQQTGTKAAYLITDRSS